MSFTCRKTCSPRWRVAGSVVATLLLVTGFAVGQPEEGQDASQAKPKAGPDDLPAPTRGSDEVFDLAPSADDVIIIQGEDGKPIAMPATATMKGFIQYLRDLDNKANRPQLPPHTITKVALEGNVSADESLAVITANIQLELTVDERVLVPLKLNDATLRDFKYTGKGTAVFADFSPERGYRYWVQGKGKHSLKFVFSVKIRTQVLQRRLQLDLPRSPVSHLKLYVPLPRVTAEALERTTLLQRSVPGRKSEIELHGIGERLDLTWQPIPDQKQVETQLRVTSLIHVVLSADSIELYATQVIRATEGSFNRIDVRLPAGFDSVELDGREFQVDPGDPNRAIITLSEPTQGPVELKWTISADDFQKSDGVPAVEGFEIENSRQQIGNVAIRSPDGYRVTENEDGSRFIRRINVSDLKNFRQPDPPIAAGEITSAYRFLKQPFRLQFDFNEIEPSYTAKANHFLRIAADQATLDTIFLFEVDRGTVPDVEIEWPHRHDEGWVVAQPPFITESAESPFTVKFDDRKKGTFTVRLRATRQVQADNKPFPVSLPTAVASRQLPSTLVVAHPDNIPVTIEFVGETAATLLPAQLSEKVELPEEFVGLQSSYYRIESAESALVATASINERSVRTNTRIKATLNDTTISIEQLIDYDVSYGRLSQLRLLVPRSIAVGPRIDNTGWLFLEDGTAANPIWTNDADIVVAPDRSARIQLESAFRGRFQLRAKFQIPITRKPSPANDEPIEIPLLRSAEADFSSIVFSVTDTGDYSVAMTGDSWNKKTEVANSMTWAADGHQTTVPLSIGFSDSNATHHYWIRNAVIQSTFESTGKCRTLASYFIKGRPRFLELSIPTQLRVANLWWGTNNLALQQLEPIESRPGWHRIVLPILPNETESVFSIEFEPFGSGRFTTNNLRELQPLRFADEIRVAQTVWEIILPSDHYLFLSPTTMTADYFWKRQLLFRRVPFESSVKLPSWLTNLDASNGAKMRGNSYRFRTSGSPSHIRIRSITMWTTVLFGAMVGLVLGMILWKLPATRHFLMFLSLAFAVSLVSLWYFEAVQLLWQPAVLGMLLAGLGAAIDSAFRRKPAPTVVAFSSPSDVILQASTVDRPVLITAGSGDSTEQRIQIVPHESVSASEAGSEAI